MNATPPILLPEAIRARFGERVHFDAPLAPYTAARIGGPVDVLLPVDSSDQLAAAAQYFWGAGLTFTIIGGGSNVLVSDRGLRGVAILNRARSVRFEEQGGHVSVEAASGVNFGSLARQAAGRSLSGLEWAAGIPGTVGGAVVGNAGAHGGDTAGNLVWAEVLSRQGERRRWEAAELAFVYRGSVLKKSPQEYVVLSALLRLERSDEESIRAKMDRFLAHRRETQPPGASMGSMFKNPTGDFAGRLIDQAGLKGLRRGEAAISSMHANFFINHGGATARDVLALINTSQQVVAEKFGVKLELEIELIGDWEGESPPNRIDNGNRQ
jgi:UDP-N-acetylmuramate dehydrogenase